MGTELLSLCSDVTLSWNEFQFAPMGKHVAFFAPFPCLLHSLFFPHPFQRCKDKLQSPVMSKCWHLSKVEFVFSSQAGVRNQPQHRILVYGEPENSVWARSLCSDVVGNWSMFLPGVCFCIVDEKSWGEERRVLGFNERALFVAFCSKLVSFQFTTTSKCCLNKWQNGSRNSVVLSQGL